MIIPRGVTREGRGRGLGPKSETQPILIKVPLVRQQYTDEYEESFRPASLHCEPHHSRI